MSTHNFILTKSVAIDISFRLDGIRRVTSLLDNAMARNNWSIARYNGICRVMSNTNGIKINIRSVKCNAGGSYRSILYLNHFLSTNTRQELGKNAAISPKIWVEVHKNRHWYHGNSCQYLYNHQG